MIPRGEVGLITASIGWAAGLISPPVFALVVALVLASTLITPLLLGLVARAPAGGGPRPSDTESETALEGKPEGGEAWSSFPRWLRARATSFKLLAVLFLTVVTMPACAMKKFAVNKLGDAIASGGTVYASDNDPELVRESVPFSLKLIESLLADSPKHRGLLMAAAKGFTEYGYAFVEEDADELEGHDLESANRTHARARLLYLRARDYGLRGLEVRHRGFGEALRENPKLAVRRIRSRKEVPLLYWTAASWGLAISISKDNPDLVADQPIVEALIDRALQLDEGFDEGAIHSFLISYEPSRQGIEGDPLKRSRKHFQRAVELSGGKLAGPFVAFAETVDVQKQDRAEFQSLLKKALDINPDAQPETRLENLVEQQRARWLLARADELFAQ